MISTPVLRQAWIVCRKELVDSLRDRRALWSIVLSVAIGPIMIAFMMNRVAERQREADEVRIPVVGAEYAPAFVDWLRQQAGVEVVAGPDDAEASVRDQLEDVVIVIPEDFAAHFRMSKPVEIKIVSDGSRRSSQPIATRVRALVQGYSSEIAGLRLIGRGVSPAAITPLRIAEVEVSTAQQRAAQILAFIPMFIIMAGFIGGMQIATDATAGERERGSLEPLLVNPAPRVAFVGGKWLAAAMIASASVLGTTALCLLLPRFLPLGDMGIQFSLGLPHLGGIIAAALPLCLFSSSLQTCVATLARSFKEAQSYLSILILLPALPGMMSALYPLGNATWMYVVPMLGPYVLLNDVISGRSSGVSAFAIAGAVSMLAAALLIRVATGLFRSERIIFVR